MTPHAILLAAPFAMAQKSLPDEIAQQDQAMFDAFNAHDAGKLQTYFSEDLEFYHDKDGLNGYAATMKAFREIFSRAPTASATRSTARTTAAPSSSSTSGRRKTATGKSRA